MKKTLCALVLLIAFTAPAGAQSRATLSPATRFYLQNIDLHPDNPTPDGYVYKLDNSGAASMSGMIKVTSAGAAEQALSLLGVSIGTKAGAVWTVRVPLEKVRAFTQAPGIAYIQLDEPLAFPKMDAARRLTHTDSVHQGIDLPMPYTGKGVIVGIIDFGFDYGHPLFYDTLGGRYRVRKVWELNGAGTPPAGYTYGRELADSNAIKAATTDNAKQTHGTAVAGMAIGSGLGSNATNRLLRGMAFDAEAVLVGVRRDSIGGQWRQSGFSDFADGINYIFKYAAAAGKPAVINISWGSQSGPHDGTSLFNQACDALVGPGKIIVMSAGNEGQERIHMSKAFTAADSQLTTYLTFTPATYQRTWVDAWGDTGKTWCMDAQLFRNGLPTSPVVSSCLDNGVHSTFLRGTGGDTCYIDFINSLAEFNGKPRATISLFNKSTDTLRITLRAKSGRLNVWDEYYYYGYDYGFQSAFRKLGDAAATEGDSMMCASDMGAAQSVLLVGAFVSRNSWKDINGNNWGYSSSYAPLYGLAAFSSRGPLVDGRIKPDITAPGLTVATGFSSYDTAYTPSGSSSDHVRGVTTFKGKSYYYAEFSGTSAASPAAAGIVALMLQAKPTLTPAECRSIIFQTALQDSYTGVLPAAGTNAWGHGKINAYGAVKRLAQQAGIAQYSGLRHLDCTLFPNPADGSFTLDYTGDRTEDLQVDIYNATGSRVRGIAWTAKAGRNLLPVSVTTLPAGAYLVRVAGRDGAVSIRAVLR